jgi:cell division protein ZapA
MSKRVVHVDIQGQKYAVRSDLDPQYIGELAVYLDEKMRLAARELASADPLRVAVMAALNVADELFHARAEAGGSNGRITARTIELERILDVALAAAGVRPAGSPAKARESA